MVDNSSWKFVFTHWLLGVGIVLFALYLCKATADCMVAVVPKNSKGFPREEKTVDMAQIVVLVHSALSTLVHGMSHSDGHHLEIGLSPRRNRVRA